jgi:divalent metal cation (Fe/Co/Zn/Cd) transporter
MSEERHMIPVWFFVGILLFLYGILIFISGITEWSHPPDTVLANVHAPVWWGAIMIVMGAVFVQLFRPGKKPK